MRIVARAIAGGASALIVLSSLAAPSIAAGPTARGEPARAAGAVTRSAPARGPRAGPLPRPSISLHATATRVRFPHNRVVLYGSVKNAPPLSVVELWQWAWPYGPNRVVATTQTAANGRYKFAARHPDRDTYYTVTLVGMHARAKLSVLVYDWTWTWVSYLPLGQVEIQEVVQHPWDMHWANQPVRWWFIPAYNQPAVTTLTRTRRLNRGAVELTATVTLPAGSFVWQDCFNAQGVYAIESPQRPRWCYGRGYNGAGSMPFGFPSAAGINQAEAYLNTRYAHTGFAVVTTEGREYGIRMHDTFLSASVVKAMLLVGYLRYLDSHGQHYVDSYSNSFLYPMIHVSDNGAATQTWSIVGDSGLYGVAQVAGMTDYSVSGGWGTSRLSAADQARFFFEMDSLIPSEFVGYARWLLSTIADYQSWGVPAVARPYGWQVFFKGGWIPSLGIVHQVARLEGGPGTFSMAVLSDGEPSFAYGIDTIQGATTSLLG